MSTLSSWFGFFEFKTGSLSIVLTGLELQDPRLYLPSAGTKGMHHHAQLIWLSSEHLFQLST